MRIPRFVAAAAALAVGLPAHAAPNTAKIGNIVTAALKEFNVPGAQVEVDTPGTHWAQSFGFSDYAARRPVTLRDHFAIRSITKSFTVTAVLQLIAASNGAVKLNDPIGDYLPDIPNGNLITIRQLANMTSGLYNYTIDPDFGAALGSDPTRHWGVDKLLSYALYSKKHPAIVFPPGSQYQYSNTNTLLLGKLVIALTAKPFPAVLNSQILRPLHLTSTVYLTGVPLPSPAATGYQGFFDNMPDPVEINATSLSFAGAMASTVTDLANWGAALAEGTLLPETLQQKRFVSRRTAGDPASPLYDSYGLGMGEIAGWWGHTGSGVGFQAAVFHDIATDETFAILLNASNSNDVPAHIFCRVLPVLHAEIPANSVCAKEPQAAP
jgi:D-alanyl-D-alanine carboxypeptidase